MLGDAPSVLQAKEENHATVLFEMTSENHLRKCILHLPLQPMQNTQVGLQKVLYTLVSGFSRNVFPVFAGPQIITFRNLLRPFSRSSFIAFVKVSFRIPFCCNTSHAQASHCPLQPSIHSPCAASSKI